MVTLQPLLILYFQPYSSFHYFVLRCTKIFIQHRSYFSFWNILASSTVFTKRLGYSLSSLNVKNFCSWFVGIPQCQHHHIHTLVLGFKPRASGILGKYTVFELSHQPFLLFWGRISLTCSVWSKLAVLLVQLEPPGGPCMILKALFLPLSLPPSLSF